MENPIKTVTSNLTVSKIVGGAVVLVAILAIVDFFGYTSAILQPYTFIKNRFFNKGASQE